MFTCIWTEHACTCYMYMYVYFIVLVVFFIRQYNVSYWQNFTFGISFCTCTCMYTMLHIVTRLYLLYFSVIREHSFPPFPFRWARGCSSQGVQRASTCHQCSPYHACCINREPRSARCTQHPLLAALPQFPCLSMESTGRRTKCTLLHHTLHPSPVPPRPLISLHVRPDACHCHPALLH